MKDGLMKGDLMKSTDSFDDFLATQLRQSQDYIPDDGFALGVMNALPAPKVRKSVAAWLITAIPLLVISLLVFSQFPFAKVFGGIWYWLIQVDATGWLQLGMGVSACITMAGIAWFMRLTSDW